MGKYLNKFYSIIDKIGKHNFILIIFIFIVLITTSLYQTFSLYTENEEVSIVDGIATYSFILNANNNTNSVTISAGESKNMDITVTNATAIPLKYGLYSSIKTNEDSYIYIGYSTATKHKPNGVIPGNTDYTVTIKVYNYSNNDITVNLGVSYGFDNEETLTLGTGYYWIDEPLTLMKTLFSKWDGDHIYYRSDEYRNKIVTASFVDIDTLETNNSSASLSNAVESWKISAGDATDNSVIAWLIAKTDNEYDGYYDLYIGARETIYADSLYALFSQLSALEDIDFTNLDTSLTTDMDFLFRDCTSLVELNLNTTEAKNANFDTANVKSMWSLFGGCANLRRLYINTLDTRKVTIMNTMFFGCASLLNTDPENDPDYEFDLSKCQNFLTNQVISMAQMFQEASSLTSLDLSKFNTSNVTSMAWMFLGCNNLTNLNLSSFNTNKITDMGYLFNNCRALTSLDLSSFDTSNVTSMYQMFKGCSSLTNLNLSSFNTSKVTNMTSLFQDCSNLTNIDLNSFNTSSVIYMNSMFNGCSNLISIDLSNFNTSNVTNMDTMFKECTSLISLDLSSFNTSNVTTMKQMFYNCYALNTKIVIRSSTSATPTYNQMFTNAATATNAQILVYYNDDTQTLVNNMVATKSSSSHVYAVIELAKMASGSYVKYVGNNGCNSANTVNGYTSCGGKNANYVSDTNKGYCSNSSYQFNANGWRIGYIENGSVHLISAGATDCMCTDSDGSISSSSCSSYVSSADYLKHIDNLDNIALNYCNKKYSKGGVCNNTTTWAIDATDFERITNSPLNSETCSAVSSEACGLNNNLINNNGFYWYATPYATPSINMFYWNPYYNYVSNHDSGAYIAGVRPVIALDPLVAVIDGSGTYEDPYTIIN